jgi:hypothetical protein
VHHSFLLKVHAAQFSSKRRQDKNGRKNLTLSQGKLGETQRMKKNQCQSLKQKSHFALIVLLKVYSAQVLDASVIGHEENK